MGFLSCALHAQSADALIHSAVDSELAASRDDHSNWLYLEDTRKTDEDVQQWVAATQHGAVRCVFEKNGQKIAAAQQQDAVQKYLHDPQAQKKQNDEDSHDNQQINDLLKLLPDAFHWTQTGATATTFQLHFEPNPQFHPPTREARVFAAMAGDLSVDRGQYRIVSISGRLRQDVTFGGGLLGRLKAGSTFALVQEQVGPSLWQLTKIDVHLQGTALLFKSVSLEEDDLRSRFVQQPGGMTLAEAGVVVLKQPE